MEEYLQRLHSRYQHLRRGETYLERRGGVPLEYLDTGDERIMARSAGRHNALPRLPVDIRRLILGPRRSFLSYVQGIRNELRRLLQSFTRLVRPLLIRYEGRGLHYATRITEIRERMRASERLTRSTVVPGASRHGASAQDFTEETLSNQLNQLQLGGTRISELTTDARRSHLQRNVFAAWQRAHRAGELRGLRSED